jgi:predicted RecA/RadA family phage recombinase
MKNYVRPGDSIPLVLPYTVTSGQGVLVGAIFGVATTDGSSGATIECLTDGVVDITKEPSLVVTQGARLFWDNTNRRLTTTATSNFHVGFAASAAAAADTTVRTLLARGPASGA